MHGFVLWFILIGVSLLTGFSGLVVCLGVVYSVSMFVGLMCAHCKLGLMHVAESSDFPSEARLRARQAMLQMLGLVHEEI